MFYTDYFFAFDKIEIRFQLHQRYFFLSICLKRVISVIRVDYRVNLKSINIFIKKYLSR